MRIRFYGRLIDAIGTEVDLDAPASTIREVRSRLSARHPKAAEALRGSRAVLADRIVSDEHEIIEAQTLEFLPPVSGG